MYLKRIFVLFSINCLLVACQSTPNKSSHHKVDKNTSNDEDSTAYIVHVPSAAPAPVTRDLWHVVRDGMELPDMHQHKHPKAKARIQQHIKRLQRSPRMIKRVSKDAERYFYYIIKEFKKNNIPLDIAMLPIVESHLDPFAYSHSSASGLWQFIPNTGKGYGLKRNWWKDDRRDTVAATQAAIKYLLYLHDMFDGDWLLAMASYNAGQGTVLNAVKRNRKKGKPTNYWSLSLPKETMHYIPKILAWREIVKSPDHHQTPLADIPYQPYFEIIDIGSQIDLAEAAKLANVDIKEIYQLNPAFSRWATDPDGLHRLAIPSTQAKLFKQRLANLPNEQRMTWRRYVVKKNDSLSKIAHQFNTTPALIAQINQMKSTHIRIGKALLIPTSTKSSKFYSHSAEQRLSKRQKKAPRTKALKHSARVKYTVKAGDTLWEIAKRYQVSTRALAQWNNMAPRDPLKINQQLVVWTNNSKYKSTKQQSIKQDKQKLFYKVKKGDSLSHIANRFRVKVSDIKYWNDIEQARYLRPGQMLTLYIAQTNREFTAN